MPVDETPRPAPPPSPPGAAAAPVGAAGAPTPPGALRVRGRKLWALARDAAKNADRHGLGRMAAALSFYAMFSLPALLVFILALAGLASSYESVQARFLAEVRAEVGVRGADAVREMIASAERLRTATSSVLWLGIGSLVFGAVGFFVELQGALNEIFGAAQQVRHDAVSRFTLKRILSFAMILGIAVLLLLSLALSTLLAAFGEHLAGWVPRVAPALLATLDLLLNTAVIAVLFAAVYRVLPDARVTWRDAWAGALVASASFSVGKFAIGTYLARSNLAIGYGTAGPLVVLLVWTFVSALVLLVGAELARARARAREPRHAAPFPSA